MLMQLAEATGDEEMRLSDADRQLCYLLPSAR